MSRLRFRLALFPLSFDDFFRFGNIAALQEAVGVHFEQRTELFLESHVVFGSNLRARYSSDSQRRVRALTEVLIFKFLSRARTKQT